MIPLALFQIRDPEMRAEYYERLREKREAAEKLPSTMPEKIPPTITPHHCENLEASRELECLEKFFPEQLTAERLLRLRERLDALINGKMKKYDDGDSVNLDYPTDIPW